MERMADTVRLDRITEMKKIQRKRWIMYRMYNDRFDLDLCAAAPNLVNLRRAAADFFCG